MADAVGGLRVDLKANTAKFSGGMRKAGMSVKKFGGVVGKAKSMVGMFSASLVGVASIGGFIAFTKRSAEAYDALGKFSDRIGANVEELQRLRHVADLTGAGADTLNAGLATLAKRLGEARRGTGAATAALAELKLSAADLSAMSPDRAFYRIADAMEAITDPGQRAAIAANLFSKANMSLLSTLDAGTAGIKRMGDELNNVLNRRQIADIEHMNDEFTKLKANLAPVGGASAAAIGETMKGLKYQKKISYRAIFLQSIMAGMGGGVATGAMASTPQVDVPNLPGESGKELAKLRASGAAQLKVANLKAAAGGQATIDNLKRNVALFGGALARMGQGFAGMIPDKVSLTGPEQPGRSRTAGAMQRGSAAAYSLEANTRQPMLEKAKKRTRLLEQILEKLGVEVVEIAR